MLIFHIYYAFQMGGAENLTLSIIRNDKKNKHIILVCKGYNEFQKYCEQRYKIKFINLHFKTNSIISISNWKSFYSVIQKYKPNVVQSYMYDASKYARLVALFLKIPVVTYVVNTYSRKIVRRAIVNHLLSYLTKKIIVNSNEVKRDIMRYEKIPEKKIIQIPSFAKLDFKVDDSLHLRKKYGFSINDYVFLFIARLVPQKGLFFLLDSMALCIKQKRINNLKLLIIGDGPLKHSLNTYIKRLSLKKYIFLVGEVKNLNPYLTEADAYVDSSINSGLSVAAIRALEASLPTIMTDVGGARQLSMNGKYVSLCSPNNKKEMSSLLSMYAQEKKIKNYDSHIFVKRNFSDSVLTKKIIKLYSEVTLK